MKISRTNKIILIIGVIYVAFTLFAAFYLKEKPKTSFQTAEREFIIDYEVSETDSGKVLKSAEAGFSMQVPQGWHTREYGRGMAVFKEEKLKGAEAILEEEEIITCLISVDISKYKGTEEIEELSASIDEVQRGEKQNDEDYSYSLVNVSERVFLIIQFHQEDKVVFVIAETFNNNMIYSVSSGLISSPDCLDQFNNTLQTITIQ